MRALLMLLLIGIMAVGGTIAYFYDVEKANGNSFQAGSIDIALTDGQANSVIFDIYDWKPGEAGEDGKLRIWNLGTNRGDHLEIRFDLTYYEDNDGNSSNGFHPGPESDPMTGMPHAGAEGMGKFLSIHHMDLKWYEGSTLTKVDQLIYNHQVTATGASPPYNLYDYNGNGYMDLDDLSHLPLDNIRPPPKQDTDGIYNGTDNYLELAMYIDFDPSAGNEYQGDITYLNITVTLNQVASQ